MLDLCPNTSQVRRRGMQMPWIPNGMAAPHPPPKKKKVNKRLIQSMTSHFETLNLKPQTLKLWNFKLWAFINMNMKNVNLNKHEFLLSWRMYAKGVRCHFGHPIPKGGKPQSRPTVIRSRRRLRNRNPRAPSWDGHPQLAHEPLPKNEIHERN